jgi:hypothetical protein
VLQVNNDFKSWEQPLTFKLQTAVAFIIFNRPDTTAKVFAEIAKAKPQKLLVISDGARDDRAGESEKVRATRAIIDGVNWPCEVLTNYSDRNLGCRRRVSSGLDWVFSVVEEAIILEDDCVPDQSFFQYCEEMLHQYRDDQRVGMINGSNFLFGKHPIAESFYFSQNAHIWGWASWRDRWQKHYDVNLEKWPALRDSQWLNKLAAQGNETKDRGRNYEAVFNGTIDTWDFQWDFAMRSAGMLAIAPSVNLITNIGFNRSDATHTTGENIAAEMPLEKMHFPLSHPHEIVPNLNADRAERAILSQRPFELKLWKRMKSLRKLFR